jgi:uncharacterized membrane protein YgaE (UPF0421/DUF939 family)
VFVFRDAYQESVTTAVLRVTATLISFALCLVDLAFLPFHPWGMALLIGIGAIIAMLAGQKDAVVTTGITTAVVMVVAALSPRDAWEQPILRLGDTAPESSSEWPLPRASNARRMSNEVVETLLRRC